MTHEKPIRALVVDDSPFFRMVLSYILEAVPGIHVAGHAGDGEEALRMAAQLMPDVITLDVEMPRMNGLETLKAIMSSPRPVPCLMVSSLTTEGAEDTMAALEEGAVDFITKPSSTTGVDIAALKAELVEKIRAAAKIPVARLLARRPDKARRPAVPRVRPANRRGTEAVLIGISTGGPPALQKMLPLFPSGFPAAIVVAQHMPAGFTKSMAERLNKACELEVKEAEEGDAVVPGRVLVGKSGMHIAFAERGGKKSVSLSRQPEEQYYPSVNVMFESAASVFGPHAMGVIMTGMGTDGTRGLKELKKRGAFTIGQSEESCVVAGMPKSAMDAGLIDRVADEDGMAEAIMEEL